MTDQESTDLLKSPEKRASFWSKIQPSADDHCWPWMRGCNRQGYGVFGFWRNGRSYQFRASRVVFLLTNGDWPDKACHTCDNPICCNPKHIVSASNKWNTRDMLRKGRHRVLKGSAQPNSKLTETEVIQIREIYALGTHTQAELANLYNISSSQVCHITKRKEWRHI